MIFLQVHTFLKKITNSKYLITSIKKQDFDVKHQISDIKFHISCLRCQALDIEYKISIIRYQVRYVK